MASVMSHPKSMGTMTPEGMCSRMFSEWRSPVPAT